MKALKLFYLLLLLLSISILGCTKDYNCRSSAIDVNVTTFDFTQNLINVFKDKKYVVLKNEAGDTLVFNINYSKKIYSDTIETTVDGDGDVCTAIVEHLEGINVILSHKDTNYIEFSDFPDYNYWARKHERDYFHAWSLKSSSVMMYSYIYPPFNKPTPHKTVNIHGKDVEVIDAAEISPEQVYLQEGKGIIAMKVASHGNGFWVVDKVE